MLFADLLSLHLVTFLMFFFILVILFITHVGPSPSGCGLSPTYTN